MSKDEQIYSAKDSELIIEKFIRNDEKALERTYEHNFKIVKNFVLQNNGREADAKDIFQEAMVAAWLNMKEGKFTVKNEFSLSAYIYKIAKYKWLDKLKSKQHKSTQSIGEKEFEDFEFEIEALNETEERIKYLGGLYNQLDSNCKDVLNRFYYQKNRLEEIADALNYDLGSVRTIKYRCMQKLRKMHLNTSGQRR